MPMHACGAWLPALLMHLLFRPVGWMYGYKKNAYTVTLGRMMSCVSMQCSNFMHPVGEDCALHTTSIVFLCHHSPVLLSMGFWTSKMLKVHCHVVTWSRLIHSCSSWRKGERSSSACQVYLLHACCKVAIIEIPGSVGHNYCWRPLRLCGPRLAAVSC